MTIRNPVRQRSEDRSSGISEKTIIEAIRNQRRRYALYYLYTQYGSVDLDELVTQVAAWETCSPPEEVRSSQRRSVYTSLYQTHLPRLEKNGLVNFDRDRNRVEDYLGETGFRLLLHDNSHTTIAWYRVYLVLSVGSAVLFGLFHFHVSSVGVLPLRAAVGTVLVLFTLVSVLHWYDVYRWRCRTENMPPDYYVFDAE